MFGRHLLPQALSWAEEGRPIIPSLLVCPDQRLLGLGKDHESTAWMQAGDEGKVRVAGEKRPAGSRLVWAQGDMNEPTRQAGGEALAGDDKKWRWEILAS